MDNYQKYVKVLNELRLSDKLPQLKYTLSFISPPESNKNICSALEENFTLKKNKWASFLQIPKSIKEEVIQESKKEDDKISSSRLLDSSLVSDRESEKSEKNSSNIPDDLISNNILKYDSESSSSSDEKDKKQEIEPFKNNDNSIKENNSNENNINENNISNLETKYSLECGIKYNVIKSSTKISYDHLLIQPKSRKSFTKENVFNKYKSNINISFNINKNYFFSLSRRDIKFDLQNKVNNKLHNTSNKNVKKFSSNILLRLRIDLYDNTKKLQYLKLVANLSKLILSYKEKTIDKNIIKYNLNNELDNIMNEFFNYLTNLTQFYDIKIISKDYRNKFDKKYIDKFGLNNHKYVYILLQKANNPKTEIIYNQEVYKFSDIIINDANKLMVSFDSLINIIIQGYNNFNNNKINKILLQLLDEEIKSRLVRFDICWTNFERHYLSEYINIQIQGYKYLREGINLVNDIKTYQKKASIKGKYLYIINSKNENPKYNEMRENFIGYLNKIYNMIKDDINDDNELSIDILYNSEKLLNNVCENQSKSLRKIAKCVIKSLDKIYSLFQGFNKNIDNINPSLDKIPELVEILDGWAKNWGRGQKFLCDENNYNCLLKFNNIIDIISEKYEEYNIKKMFKDKNGNQNFIDIITSTIILDSFDRKNIELLLKFIPDIEADEFYQKTKRIFYKIYNKVNNKYSAYNLIENYFLFKQLGNGNYLRCKEKMNTYISEKSLDNLDIYINDLRNKLQRNKPKTWNTFLYLAMNI